MKEHLLKKELNLSTTGVNIFIYPFRKKSISKLKILFGSRSNRLISRLVQQRLLWAPAQIRRAVPNLYSANSNRQPSFSFTFNRLSFARKFCYDVVLVISSRLPLLHEVSVNFGIALQLSNLPFLHHSRTSSL